MRKFAFFVEGQTERIFLEHFISSYFTYPIAISDSKKIIGDRIITIRSNSTLEKTEYYFLLYDVGNDAGVISRILEYAKNMIENQKFEKIFGLRDLYPFERDKKCPMVNKIKEEFQKTGVDDKLKLILAIMEIESWLLSDSEVFSRINSTLTTDYIKNHLGIDLVKDNPEYMNKPSSTINRIFNLVGSGYDKTEADSYKIISRIDFCNLCFSDDILAKVSSIKYFLEKLNEAIE
jgi:hypothetical protein